MSMAASSQWTRGIHSVNIFNILISHAYCLFTCFLYKSEKWTIAQITIIYKALNNTLLLKYLERVAHSDQNQVVSLSLDTVATLAGVQFASSELIMCHFPINISILSVSFESSILTHINCTIIKPYDILRHIQLCSSLSLRCNSPFSEPILWRNTVSGALLSLYFHIMIEIRAVCSSVAQN